MGELQRTNGAPQNVPMIPSTIESVLIQGDVGKMSAEQRVDYYNALCNSLGLNPLTQPFEYLTLNGKVKLYAKKDCTDQLRRIYGISIKLTSKDIMGDIYVVTAEATNASGRSDESTGAGSLSSARRWLASMSCSGAATGVVPTLSTEPSIALGR